MKKLLSFILMTAASVSLLSAATLKKFSVKLSMEGAPTELYKAIAINLKNNLPKFASLEFDKESEYKLHIIINDYKEGVQTCHANIKVVSASGSQVAEFTGAFGINNLKSELFTKAIAVKIGPNVPGLLTSTSPKTREYWVAQANPAAPAAAANSAVAAAKPAASAPATTSTAAAAKPAAATPSSHASSAAASKNYAAPSNPQNATASINAAKAEEAKGNYVIALTHFCKAGTADPWNQTAIDGITRIAKNLAASKWGNSTFGVNESDPYRILNAWAAMEFEYQRFLSAVPRYKLTYNATARGESQNTYERECGAVRFVVKDFKFTKEFPGYNYLKNAFKALSNSSFSLAATVQDFTRNNSDIGLAPTGWMNTRCLGGDYNSEKGTYNYPPNPEYKLATLDIFETGVSSKEMTVKESASLALGFMKEIARTVKNEVSRDIGYEGSNPVMGNVPEKYWYEWTPSVKIAIADSSGKIISDWLWWNYKSNPEIYMPFEKAGYADHFVISSNWRMVDTGILKKVIDYNSIKIVFSDIYYTPKADQIVVKH